MTTTRCPAWRARGRRSAEGSEVADVEEEEGEDEAEVVAEVGFYFYFFLPTDADVKH